MKRIFKFLSIVTIFTMALSLTTAAFADTANINLNVNTSLDRSDSGGLAPIIKAKWEMKDTATTTPALWAGADDSVSAGAQILPPVAYDASKTVVYCAIATDPDGVADINAVYADVYYPVDKKVHEPATDPRYGCGHQLGDEVLLSKLSKEQGYDLFCNRIQTYNNNLPIIRTEYSYNEICKTDGELMKETAYVYCGTRPLYYEDPAGLYKVNVFAQDKGGLNSPTLTNNLEYLPVTAFEIDFGSLAYGSVKLNTEKIKNGDLVWEDAADNASVRNIGNTRLSMTVSQNDMGLGTTGGNPNVSYKARVGSSAAFTSYIPGQTVTLVDILGLSETNEMDFGITVLKFPNSNTSYSGTMTLGAIQAGFLTCLQGEQEQH